MKSRLKLYGPGIVKALTLLDELSADIKKISHGSHEAFTEEIKDKRDLKKILKRGLTKIGSYDFNFTWLETPNVEDIMDLIQKIDEKLAQTTVKYTITTTAVSGELTDFDLRENSAISVLKFIGPSIHGAIRKLEEKTDEIPWIFSAGTLEKGFSTVGEFDYTISWGMYPTVDMILKVIETIDGIIGETASYTITTFGKMKKEDKAAEQAYKKALIQKERKSIPIDPRV